MSDLSSKHCLPCEGGVQALELETLKNYLEQLGKNWQISSDHKILFKNFQFKNYYQTMAFVNAIAWIAHQENHHPDLEIGYNHCLVQYTTHAAKGLSENDFICADKVENLIESPSEKQCSLK